MYRHSNPRRAQYQMGRLFVLLTVLAGVPFSPAAFARPRWSEQVAQAWYGKTFGAKPGMRGRFQAADIPGANLTFTKSDQPTVTTKGHVLDHIGFDVTDMDAFLKKAAAAGVKPVVAPTKNPASGVWLAFIQDPWGTYIELNQRPNQTYLNQM